MNDPAIHDVREWYPRARLRSHAVCAWEQEVAPESAVFVHRRAPTGSVELMWTVGSAPRIVGPQTGPLLQSLTPRTRIVGLRLRPEAATAVLGLPASELLDLDIAAEELWGAGGRKLQDDLGETRSGRAAAALLQRFVGSRLAGNTPDPVIAEAVRGLGSARQPAVVALAQSLFVSERQFRRRCKAVTGLAPGALHAILRFHRFLALAWTVDRPSRRLGWLAAATGYADQSHLTREAVQWAGRPPGELLRESEQRCGCGHDHRASYGAALNGLAQAAR